MTDKFDFKLCNLHSWAEFSGDYNPIHFKPEAASRAGFPKLVTHGMLAMMPVKNRIAAWVPGHRGFSVNINLRKPVFVDESLVCEGDASGDRCKVWLKGEDGTRYFAIARPLPDRDSNGTSPTWTDFEQLEARDISSDYDDFSEKFPKSKALWQALDAILFKYYVRRNGGSALAKDTREYLKEQSDMAHVQSVVQTTHEVDVFPAAGTHDAQLLKDVRIYTRGLQIERTKDAAFGSVESYAVLKDNVVIAQRMALMAVSI
jgi:hypothetical protein